MVRIFTSRQLAGHIRQEHPKGLLILKKNYGSLELVEAVVISRLAVDRRRAECSICHYDVSRDSMSGTFQHTSDYMGFFEAASTGDTAGTFLGRVDWVARYVDHGLD